MTSADPRKPALEIPFIMASSGCCGVDNSLNITILPSRMTTKSVNVPPVSTPILEVDPRDILDKFRGDRFNILDCALRVAFPCQCLKIGAYSIEHVNSDFAHPRKVLVRRRIRGDLFDPLNNSFTLFGIGADFECGSLTGIHNKLDVMPPAGLNHL